MKRTLLSFLLTVFTLAAYAQVAKMPLIEHFTQASCGPCASQNPTLKNRLDAFGTSNYVRISHQTSWPGVDPMNAAFPAGPDVRRTYYGVTGVPNTSLNGGAVGGSGTVITANTLASAAAQTTPYEIVASQTWLSIDELRVDVQINNTTSNPVSTANRIYVTMLEDHVAYTAAPGSNGETDFEYVMRQMYNASNGSPNATNGAALANIPANGSVSYSFTLNSLPSYISDISQISFAIYLQNSNSKTILQAAKTAAAVPPGELAVRATSQSVVGSGYCDLSFSPEVVLSNDSQDVDVTSAVIEYSINGGAPVQETYNGTLMPGQSATITFPSGFLASGNSSLEYRVVSVNGGQNWLSAAAVDMPAELYSKLSDLGINGGISEDLENAPLIAGTGYSRDISSGIFDADPSINEQLFSILDGPSYNYGPIGGFALSDRSIRFRYFSVNSGEELKLVMQKVNLGTNSQLTFSHAYRQYINENDALAVEVSTDCGSTWTNVFNQSGVILSTLPASTAQYVPASANDWRTNTVDLSAYDGLNDVIVRFKGTSGFGNNLYLDDMAITSTLSVQEISNVRLKLYPNPTDKSLYVSGLDAERTYKVFNLQGSLVLEGLISNETEISVENLSQGLFILKVDGHSAVKFSKI
ncbi:MAG: T9SS type A sorting domain-containing protein [Nonlabens sp.]